jgi:hypothetical protein
VVRISADTGRVLRVLYPSGRYLILDAGAGSARVNGWIDHRRLVPLAPANGNAADYEAW